MNVTEVLQIADELVFAQTGKHLDDTQEAVFKGVWQGQTYSAIADECNRSESRIRDVGYKLLKILSAQLGEDINKSNFRSTLKRLKITSSPIIIQNNNHTFNFCPSSSQPSNNDQKDVDQNLSYYDLKLAPKITQFYGRENELKTLSYWIENQKNHLISVLGITGIGKTTLVKKFVDLNIDKFEVIIWKNLKFPKSLNLLINDLLNVCEEEPKETLYDKLKQLFDILTHKKCLIILDDVHNIFISGQFAGQYQPEYKDYQNFFKMITEMEHQSCVILISQEKCQAMTSLDDELYPVQCLELSGLGESARELLQYQRLKNQESWLQLIDLYEGNPLYLHLTCSIIKDIFDGNVSEFIRENTLLLTEDFNSLFDLLWLRLSEIEKQIILEVGQKDYTFTRDELKESLSLSSTDIVKGLQSLTRRYLVNKIEENSLLFILSPVFREYIKVYQQK